MKNLARHPGIRGKLADKGLNVIPPDISMVFGDGKPSLINRKAFRLHLEPKVDTWTEPATNLT